MPRDGQNQTFGREGNPFPRTLHAWPEFSLYPWDRGMIVLCFSWGLIVVTWNFCDFCSSLPPPPSALVTSPPLHIVIMPLPAEAVFRQPGSFLFIPKCYTKALSWYQEIRAYPPEERASLHGHLQSSLTSTGQTWARTGETQCSVTASSVISLRE